MRAAALLELPLKADDHDEVQWMGVLRSLSAMQMFQRWHRGPIDGDSVVRFLVTDPSFPRSVRACLARIRRSLDQLPPRKPVMVAVDELDAALGAHWVDGDDALALDAAMDLLQLRLAALSAAINDEFFAGRS